MANLTTTVPISPPFTNCAVQSRQMTQECLLTMDLAEKHVPEVSCPIWKIFIKARNNFEKIFDFSVWWPKKMQH